MSLCHRFGCKTTNNLWYYKIFSRFFSNSLIHFSIWGGSPMGMHQRRGVSPKSEGREGTMRKRAGKSARANWSDFFSKKFGGVGILLYLCSADLKHRWPPCEVHVAVLNWECEWESPTVPQQWTPLWLLSNQAIVCTRRWEGAWEWSKVWRPAWHGNQPRLSM